MPNTELSDNPDLTELADTVLSQILLEFECGHRPDIIMLRPPQTAEMQ